jgi:hypothetical protein
MASWIDRGFALLNRTTSPAAETTVRYSRAATVISEAMPATFTAAQVQSVANDGATVIGREFHWSLKRQELRWDGAEDRPRRDDVIEWELNGRVYHFVVLPEPLRSEALAVDPRSDWVPASTKLDSIGNA